MLQHFVPLQWFCVGVGVVVAVIVVVIVVVDIGCCWYVAIFPHKHSPSNQPPLLQILHHTEDTHKNQPIHIYQWWSCWLLILSRRNQLLTLSHGKLASKPGDLCNGLGYAARRWVLSWGREFEFHNGLVVKNWWLILTTRWLLPIDSGYQLITASSWVVMTVPETVSYNLNDC